MGAIRDMEIVWEDLLDAFENSDPDIVYLLDRNTGDVFFVPADYEDDDFWEEIEESADQYLHIPCFDYDQERLLMHEFIQGIGNEKLKGILNRTFTGKKPYGRLEDILSFYPEEFDRFTALREELIADRIRHWLEEHDIFPGGETL